MIKKHLYFHVPYCVSKCGYCAFYSNAGCADWDAYSHAIIRDIKYWSNKCGRGSIETVFFGGGTPSLMPTDVFSRIMDAVKAEFDLIDGAEITLEANPGTLDRHRLIEFVSFGVNRLSVGVQSLDDDVLNFLGRGHSADQAIQLLNDAVNLGIRVSADFIYGLPGQTVSDVRELCLQIGAIGLSHVSMYELSIEPGTRFARDNISVVDQEMGAEMYCAIQEELAKVGLNRYEVSNYAKVGQECQHNLGVWNGDSYIGIGPAACGRVLVDGSWFEQEYLSDVLKWINGDALIFNKMDNRTRAIERVMLGLRTVYGVRVDSDVVGALDWDRVQAYLDRGLLNAVSLVAGKRRCENMAEIATPPLAVRNDNKKNDGLVEKLVVSRDGMVILDSILADILIF